MAGPKCTAAQLDARISLIIQWLGEGLKVHEIRAQSKQQWGITKRQTELYTTRARDIIRERAFGKCEDLVADSVAWYEKIIHDPSQQTRDRIYARERMDKLLGLEKHYAPQQISDITETLAIIVARKLLNGEVTVENQPKQIVDIAPVVNDSPP